MSSPHALPKPDFFPWRIAVVGAGGQLGTALTRQLGGQGIPLSRTDLDITDEDAVNRILDRLRPDVVINCAAWTAVDAAEQNPDGCRTVNATGVEHLARACTNLGALLVQVSTDYVFGADHGRAAPYREDDPPAPLNMYGASKLAGERVARICPRHIVVRTCGLYAASPNGPVRGRNFLDTMLVLAATRPEVSVVADQVCTPSHVPDVADGILRLVAAGVTGTFHVVNEGQASWCDVATELFRQAGLPTRAVPIESSAYPSPVTRPRYSVLDTSAFLAATGFRLPRWTDGVTDYLRSLACATRPAKVHPSRRSEQISCSPSS